uniref:U8 snoRNA-decapping enzyme n=1 Tax=Xiphophorus maculatus TaxID=8083 RepID=A0A3B5PW55_XIPMA
MASGQMSRDEALECTRCRHACHVMLYSETASQLFGRIPIRYIVLMQMRFDGLLGFPGGFVNPSEETLEAGLTRELLEELGVAVPVSTEDHVESCFSPPRSGTCSSSSRLILHFYVKKIEEEQIREIEKAAASTAADHGLEVMSDELQVTCRTPRSAPASPLPLLLSPSRCWEWSESLFTPQNPAEASHAFCRTLSLALLAPSC